MIHDVTILEIIFLKPGVGVFLDFEGVISFLIEKFVDIGEVGGFKFDECFT
jgi:hypothetical protein